MGVGMPQHMMLEEFGAKVWDAFGDVPYHVGSSFTQKTGWRDVDIRLLLDDETYKEMGFGDPRFPLHNGKWVAMCAAFSALGKQMTGLPIDFQIQETTTANKQYKGKRSAIGMIPSKMHKADYRDKRIHELEEFISSLVSRSSSASDSPESDLSRKAREILDES